MTSIAFESIAIALLAFEALRTPGKITAALRGGGRQALTALATDLDAATVADIEEKAATMAESGIGVVMYGDDDFPESLVHSGKPLMPILFLRGNKDLLYRDGVGMCGSRNVTPQGLLAASRCGAAVSARNLTIVSGYAKGVDTATHLAALRNGGATIVVLAEGMDHFRIKRDFANDFDPDRTLVLSQFAPTQTWQAYAAMARNAVIYGLSKALVVIEAGERGGTLAAGQGALKLGRPVLVVDFGERTPPGNQILLAEGAVPVSTPNDLKRALDRLGDPKPLEVTAAHLF